jgi:hypothetical protein
MTTTWIVIRGDFVLGVRPVDDGDASLRGRPWCA